jgi:hypothetical protein
VKRFEDGIRVWVHVASATFEVVGSVVSWIAFWTGIVAPLSYLVFVVPGLRTEVRFTTFLTLVGIHCLALIIGYPHRRTDT